MRLCFCFGYQNVACYSLEVHRAPICLLFSLCPDRKKEATGRTAVCVQRSVDERPDALAGDRSTSVVRHEPRSQRCSILASKGSADVS